MEKSFRAGKTVLVVEDNAEAREIFVFTLVKHGYLVQEAGDGEEALLKLEDADVDVIVTDLRMPRMDGIQLAAVLKQSALFHHIPLIALTATPLANKASMLRQFSGLLLKPCSIEDLVRAVDRAAAINTQ